MTTADPTAVRSPAREGQDGLQRVFSRPRWFRGAGRDWADVWRYRELLSNLVRKELKVKYKDSVLGFFWTLVRPLLQLLVYSVAIGIFLGSGKQIPEFGIYLFTGLVAWTLFTDIIGGSTGSIVSNAGLVKKVYLPLELFPFSVVGASAVNFVLQLVVLLGAYVVTGTWPAPGDLFLVPLALLVLVLFATALGLILAAANVYLRDVQYLVEVGLLLWFWMTPIVYDWTKVQQNLQGAHEWLFQLYMANPMTNVVLAFQRALWPGGRTEQGAPFYYDGNLELRLAVVGAVSLVLLWFAQRVFARAQGNFAQEL
ncbi:ABC transporter permease [Cellulomonas fimi]|uniref:ABC transporter permease n=1 Tax=Cellulomonas fimi TaxID=1708 RepID=UPI00234D0560|nr:ABC transporter permease [Cellulomonas fimi]MDC7122970.1 ABC transporter permease [Cellulomonas fimi]